jgi:hypothetical protein
LLLAMVLGSGAAVAGAPERKRVSGRATMASSICRGGVAVTQEDLDRLPPPRPLPGKEFLVVGGDRIKGGRPAARFVTRADGSFSTALPPGKWCFFEAARRLGEPERAAAPKAARVDADCLEAERHRCDLVLVVKSDVPRAEISFTERCPQAWAQPCYHGPMPP